MFPNVRWLLAAMLASILVLGGGFGLFASLRVTHEPLTHLPPGAGPPQSFADNPDTALRAPIVVAPFQSRFPADNRPVVQVAANLNALRLDRGETSAPIDPPPPQQAVTADTAALAQTTEPPASTKLLDVAADRPAADPATVDSETITVASTELPAPAPASTRAVDPAEAIPLPRAAPAQPSAEPPRAAPKAKATRPVVKRTAVKERVAAKTRVAAKERVAAKPRRAHRFRQRDSGDAFATAQPSFQNPPFTNPPFPSQPSFQSQGPAVQTSRSSRRAGGTVPMGGPFVAPSGIDPY